MIGKLSIIVGNNKKGDIIVREGDDIYQLAKSFMASYSLKKDVLGTIIESIEKLINTKGSSDS